MVSEMLWVHYMWDHMHQLHHEYGHSKHQRTRLKKTWSGCVGADMRAFEVGGIDPQNRETGGLVSETSHLLPSRHTPMSLGVYLIAAGVPDCQGHPQQLNKLRIKSESSQKSKNYR